MQVALAWLLQRSSNVPSDPRHIIRQTSSRETRSIIVNGIGAVATGITVIVVLAAKFAEGAWVTMLLIPALLTLMVYVRKHYHNVFLETRCAAPLAVTNLAEPLVNPQPST